MNVEPVRAARWAAHEAEPAAPAAAGIPRRDAPPADPAQLARLLDGADTMTTLHAMQVFARDAQQALGESAVVQRKSEVEAARARVHEALERAQREAEAKADSDGWTGTLMSVAKVASVVAAAASVVLSGGASAPLLIGLAGTLISAGAKPIAGVLGGGEATEAALRYGGLLASLGGGAANLASGAAGASSVATAARAVKAGAGAVAGASTAAAGYTTSLSGQHEAAALRARADEAAGRAQQQKALRQVEALIDTLEEVDRSFNRAKIALINAAESQAASELTLASGGVRA